MSVIGKTAAASLASVLCAVVYAGEPQPLATGGTGPSPAMMYTIAELPDNTLYEPQVHAGDAKPLPVLVWGNGGCADIGSSAKNVLLEVASHGFFVIALGVPGEWPPKQGGGEMHSTRTSQVIDAIDWVTKENARQGSPYYHRLQPTKLAVAGHSCGGLQALQAATDPRVKTGVIMDSGVLLDPPPMPMPGVNTNDKNALQLIHVPLLYVIGGPTDIAYKNALDDYERLTKIPVFMANRNVGHGGTFQEPNGGAWAQVLTAWLQWRLKGDTTAARMFLGKQCGLCVDAAWTVQMKGMTPNL